MIATIDFSKVSAPDIVVICIFFVWAILSFGYWLDGFEKEPKGGSALDLILKYSPPWWRFVTRIVFGIVIVYALLNLLLSKFFKI